jgi:hypothetical protein
MTGFPVFGATKAGKLFATPAFVSGVALRNHMPSQRPGKGMKARGDGWFGRSHGTVLKEAELTTGQIRIVPKTGKNLRCALRNQIS